MQKSHIHVFVLTKYCQLVHPVRPLITPDKLLKWQSVHQWPNIFFLCLMPDNVTDQGETAAAQKYEAWQCFYDMFLL